MSKTDPPHLIYFADPMCSWCWGFSPTIAAIVERFGEGLPIRLVVGGLRPGTTTAMTTERAAELRGHWREVTEASGQPFGASAIDGEGFVYDTDPAARAVVVARRASLAAGLLYLETAHRAFYVDGRDVTNPGVLADLADELGHDRARFAVDLASDAAREETWRDYALAQNAGVRGFPTLIVGPGADGQYTMVTRGFQASDGVSATIDAWLAAH